MTHLERILIPVDFSASSAIAARHAGALARHFRSEITLLHVNEFLVVHSLTGPLGFGITQANAAQAEHMAKRQKELDEFGGPELSGIRVNRVICCGDPAKQIAERARAERSDLILMPTHGHGTFRRFLLGSVTAKVLHDAECPVWTGTHLADAPALSPTEVCHVMCAVNFGPESVKAMRWAADFASEFGAKLTVVNAVLETPPSLPERYAFQWHGEAHCGAKERLRTLLLNSSIEADALVVGDGEVPKAICAAAQEKGAGLLVIGRNGTGDTARRLGAHTYAIICHAPCPVVSI
jgi:nucleotide-binding universal stress UspA family protein